MSIRSHLLCTFGLASLCVTSSLAAVTLTGTVTNRTKNKPVGGDDVVLIRLSQGMQEAARTQTNAAGRYTLDVPDDGLHLVRVTHDKANYFKAVQPGTTSVDVDVFTAAAKVPGIVAEADVMRLQTDASGGLLRIVENFFLKNDSDPPMTQFSEKPFDFFLPAGAVVEGSAALAPGGMPVQSAPVPLSDPNHYTFIFPIRPGETRFQITYHLPYNGQANLAPRPTMATDTVAVMLPKSMQFRPATDSPFTAISDEVNAQTFVARRVQPSQGLGFAVSGSGQLPRDTQANTPDGGQAAPGNATAEAGTPSATPDQTKFGGGLGNPVDPGATNDPWAKYRWWVLGGLGLALATGAGVLLKRKPEGGQTAPAAEGWPPAQPVPAVRVDEPGILHALKEEMFRLESDRLRGHVAEADYREAKSALDTLLRRVIEREGAGAPDSHSAPPELSHLGRR